MARYAALILCILGGFGVMAVDFIQQRSVQLASLSEGPAAGFGPSDYFAALPARFGLITDPDVPQPEPYPATDESRSPDQATGSFWTGDIVDSIWGRTTATAPMVTMPVLTVVPTELGTPTDLGSPAVAPVVPAPSLEPVEAAPPVEAEKTQKITCTIDKGAKRCRISYE